MRLEDRTVAIIVGSSGKDTLAGTIGDDFLYGLAGDDFLNGGSGRDFMLGGTGNDTFVVNAALDEVVENANEGIDTVNSTVTFTLAANVENLSLQGSAAINGAGNGVDNTILGNSGHNSLFGGGGNDSLSGGDGNDTLNGDAGNDRMSGGDGDDTYFAEGNNADLVDEAAGEGTDRVFVSNGLVLQNGSEIEVMQAFGTLGVILHGNDTAGQLLIGGIGNDLLAAGLESTGATLIGGAGNDSYSNVTSEDILIEAQNGGTDGVEFDPAAGAGNAFTLPDHVENLENDSIAAAAARLTGNAQANLIRGAGGADTIFGLGGNDVLLGLGGDDTLDGGGEADSIFGDIGADTLSGGGGNDSIDGQAGADVMQGGGGDDTFIVDDAGDSVAENANDGFDTIKSAVAFTLGAGIEELFLLGTSSVNGTGNGIDNRLFGNNAANTLLGLGATDFLNGQGGDDVIDGGSGVDTMVGGTGNDTFFVDDPGDIVLDAPDQGQDSVFATGSTVLYVGQAIEVVQLIGGADSDATGNDRAQTLVGNTGNNVISSGAGNDEMFGQGGNDTFVYALGDGDDLIGDFEGAGVALGDVVVLENTGITNFGDLLAATVDVAGGCEITLSAGQQLSFRAVAKAQFDASDFVFA
jgi:trimeric autotransporter adhesin